MNIKSSLVLAVTADSLCEESSIAVASVESKLSKNLVTAQSSTRDRALTFWLPGGSRRVHVAGEIVQTRLWSRRRGLPRVSRELVLPVVLENHHRVKQACEKWDKNRLISLLFVRC